MKHISEIQINRPEVLFKTRRAELINRLHDGIWEKAKETGYKLDKGWTEDKIAIRCNKNPALKKDEGLELLIKECEQMGNYKKFWWATTVK